MQEKNTPSLTHARSSMMIQNDEEVNARAVYNVESCACLVSITNFVETYITSRINKCKQGLDSEARVCLCELDNTQRCQMRIHVGIIAARYDVFVMNYTLTTQEKLKQVEFFSLFQVTECVQDSAKSPEIIDKNSCHFNSKHHQHLLRYVSGCDKDGWLAHKHAFIHNEIACGLLQVLPHEHAHVSIVYNIMNSLSLDIKNRATRAGFCMHI